MTLKKIIRYNFNTDLQYAGGFIYFDFMVVNGRLGHYLDIVIKDKSLTCKKTILFL